jgi:Flp pilus assembly protein TadD
MADDKPESALAVARAFVSSTPGPTADLLLADTLVRLKRTNDALTVLEKSLASTPNALVALTLSQVAKATGDPRKAETVLANWLGKNPNDIDLRRGYGSLLLESGDVSGARREFETLLRQRADDPVALNNLGWLLQKDDPERALSLVTRAERIAPRSAEIADTLGWMKYQRKDYQGALPLLQRAHDLDTDNAWIAYHLALVLDATGKRAEAKTLLASALARNPKFDDLENAKRLLASW